MSLSAALNGEPQLRRPARWNGSPANYEADDALVRRCATCNRVFLTSVLDTVDDRGRRRKYAGKARLNCVTCTDIPDPMTRTTTCDDVRSGAWRPGPELAATLRAHGQEISACPACGKVRLRLAGQACGGSGCDKQRGLFA